MLRTLDEWDHDASQGLLLEPVYETNRPNTNIGCPHGVGHADGTVRMCSAHLWDTPYFTRDIPPKRKIRCYVCGWEGARVIARGMGETRMRKEERSVSSVYRLTRAEILTTVTLFMLILGYFHDSNKDWRTSIEEARSECKHEVEKLREEYQQAIRDIRGQSK